MKNIKKFDDFINEGKVSQFFLKHIFNSIEKIARIVKRIKGTYIPLKCKDKKLEKQLDNAIIAILDHTIFDMLKFKLSKKFQDEAMSTNLSQLIKKRSGTDLYELGDFVKNSLVEDNFIFSNNAEIKAKQLEKLKNASDGIEKFIAFIKKIDDEILDDQEFRQTLKDLTVMFAEIDPRRIRGSQEEEKERVLGAFDRIKDRLDDSQRPKELDAILDKISKYGMASLTDKEQSDLDKWSK